MCTDDPICDALATTHPPAMLPRPLVGGIQRPGRWRLRTWAAVALGALLLRPAMVDATVGIAPYEFVEHSANHRFAVRIVPARPAVEQEPGDVLGSPREAEPARATIYAVEADGQMRPLSTFDLGDCQWPGPVLLSNDGRRLVNLGGYCWGSAVAIVGQGGTLIRSFAPEDLLTEGDLRTLLVASGGIGWQERSSTKRRTGWCSRSAGWRAGGPTARSRARSRSIWATATPCCRSGNSSPASSDR